MKPEPLIKDYMTQQPRSIEAGDSIEKARQLMVQIGVRHLPVMKDDTLVGILSERELNLVNGIESIDPSRLLVIDVCSQKPCVVMPDTPLRVVAKIMAREHYGSMIIAEYGKPVGIFTTSDACGVLSEALTALVSGKGIEEVRGRSCSYEY
jgi:acetoin utilization protein AcuB